MTQQNFIEQLWPLAIKHGIKGRVLPALIMAQGILESASGTSELAVNACNLFGVKKGSGWSGPVYVKSSKEFDAGLGWSAPVSEFRKYESIEDSVIDLVEKYQSPRYAAVLNQTDLLTAAMAAWVAGYATDPTYPFKLQKVYEEYLAPKEGGIDVSEKVVTIAAGHAGFGVTPGKRGPDGKFEWVWNNQVVLAAIERLNEYEGIRVVRVDDPTGRTDVSLGTRAARANSLKADLHWDVHHNAMGPDWFAGPGGIETFIMSPASANPSSYKAAQEIHARIVKAMGLRDRGIKSANFQMLRTTKMPAVLSEGGFMDSRIDRAVMDQPAYPRAQGRGGADGVAAFLGKKLKSGVVTVSNPVKSYFIINDKGPEIVELQTNLNEVGIKLAIDGYFGGDTKAAVIAFQKKYGLEPDGVFGIASKNKMAQLLAAKLQPPKNLFRVRESWANSDSQLGAYADLAGAKVVADLNPGYEVYDDAGRQVYPVVKPAAPAAAKWYRVRKTWADEAGQIGAFLDPEEAKALADKNAAAGFEVYGPTGDVFYTPRPLVFPKGSELMVLADWQKKEVASVFKAARDKGIFDDAVHEEAVLNGTMSRSYYEYLLAIISGAALNGGKRIK